MSVASLGEDGLLARVTPRFRRGPDTRVGPGDDCAVIRVSTGTYVVTTDVLVEGQHFTTDWSGPADIGRRAAAQNLADVAAMGARPHALTVGLALPPATSEGWVEALAAGLAERAEAAGAGIEGGDLTATDGPVVIAVTALGVLSGDPVLRSGARVGDAVCLAGTLGYSRTGYELYARGHAGSRAADAGGGCARLVERCATVFRAPDPPLEAAIAAAPGLHAMMDVSDGLVRDAARMARASRVTIDLDTAALMPWSGPLSALDGLCGTPALTRVLAGGEDHGFLATAPANAVPDGFVVIGEVRADAGTAVLVDHEPYPGERGWESLPRTE